MRTGQMEETLLPKFLALPIFASDPLSSVAYATESALVVLVGVSAVSAHLVFPISIAISVLLGIVVLSYIQTVRVYETSGGAYIVARENLGTLPSLIGAAALLTDYVLTVAVSISAGIFAITSFVPSLAHHKVALSLAALALIVLTNLRGVRESGLLFALPTYLFVASIGALIVAGLVQIATGGAHQAVTAHALPEGTGTITLFVLLRAFLLARPRSPALKRSPTASTHSGSRTARTPPGPSPSSARSPSPSSSASPISPSTCTRGRARPTRSSRRSRVPSSHPGQPDRSCTTRSRD